VPAAELATTGLPGTHVLVIENERSLYQLPSLPDTVAVLGSGLDLAWMRAPGFNINAALAVPEPHPASDYPANALNEMERALFLPAKR
jgi:hypothetical protein